MPSAVSFRYARALVDVVAGPHVPAAAELPGAIGTQLADFHSLLQENTELRILFSTPAVPVVKKQAILAELAHSLGLDSATQNFLNVVLQHDRMALLGEISEAFKSLLNERFGVAVAEITTARPLEEGEKEELSGALQTRTGKKIRMNFSLDPSLIGGVIARIGSTIYDGSVRGHLQRLRTNLIGE